VERVLSMRKKNGPHDVPLVEVLARYDLYAGEVGHGEPRSATSVELFNAFGTNDRDECIRHILLHGEDVHHVKLRRNN